MVYKDNREDCGGFNATLTTTEYSPSPEVSIFINLVMKIKYSKLKYII